MTSRRFAVLFVCTGNICRSPIAEAMLRSFAARSQLAERISVDSAGTHDYQLGQPPDPRAVAAAERRGYPVRPRQARLVSAEDFTHFDMIVAMDRGHLEVLEALRPAEYRGYVGLLLDFAPGLSMRDVPDPYNDAPERFEYVVDLIERGSEGLFESIYAGMVGKASPALRATW